ncbi:hypothetical protein FOA43_004794 [Brettanomyces nanus]|uniref:Cytochrome b5 heme-binding domain-containing protein n=1 Tax=Eeniella nana TaxID=13502 RepID=A0A875S732_EENNA|nr:uncharacterized protein FOA43_004794 [Brettanomyces nanus]QPG77381.1 hypothetical protein FOA43_004794 [Brettanomyces nanus]
MSTDEVLRHNKKDDLWMIIHGNVYDVTKFVDEHPGGEEVLLDVAGTDATDAFEDIGHSDDAREILKDLYLGKVDGVATTASTTSSGSGGGSNSLEPTNSQIPLFAALALMLAVIAYFYHQQ